MRFKVQTKQNKTMQWDAKGTIFQPREFVLTKQRNKDALRGGTLMKISVDCSASWVSGQKEASWHRSGTQFSRFNGCISGVLDKLWPDYTVSSKYMPNRLSVYMHQSWWNFAHFFCILAFTGDWPNTAGFVLHPVKNFSLNSFLKSCVKLGRNKYLAFPLQTKLSRVILIIASMLSFYTKNF